MASHKADVSYPEGLDAAILRALPSFLDRKRPASQLIRGLRVNRALRTFTGVTDQQVEAALSAMVDAGRFNPEQYVTIEEGRGRRREGRVPAAVAG